VSGATAFLALVLDGAAPLPQIRILRDRRSPNRTVHPIPHIVNITQRAKFSVHCDSSMSEQSLVDGRQSLACDHSND
jgi:hypothetical protein